MQTGEQQTLMNCSIKSSIRKQQKIEFRKGRKRSPIFKQLSTKVYLYDVRDVNGLEREVFTAKPKTKYAMPYSLSTAWFSRKFPKIMVYQMTPEGFIENYKTFLKNLHSLKTFVGKTEFTKKEMKK